MLVPEKSLTHENTYEDLFPQHLDTHVSYTVGTYTNPWTALRTSDRRYFVEFSWKRNFGHVSVVTLV